MNRKRIEGLLAVLGIWLTAGVALPFVNRLTNVSPEQLLTARGVVTAVFAFLLLGGDVFSVDRYTLLLAPILGLASFGLFKGIRAWGAGPTLIIVTLTPLLNFIFTRLSGKHVARSALRGLAFLFVGAILSHWGWHYHHAGLCYSLFGTLCNAGVYELFARAKSKALQQCFWGMFGMGSIGMFLSASSNWHAVLDQPSLVATLIGFALVSGLLYWLANIAAFERLPKDHASVLAQGETPAVILMAWFIVGERITLIQGIGVLVSLTGAWILKRSLTPEARPERI